MKKVNYYSLLTIFFMLSSLFFLVINTGKGFDVTDESFYLLITSHPQDQMIGLTWFGYITSFLFKLSNQNIAIFRMLGLIGILMMSFCFARAFCHYCNHRFSDILREKNLIILVITISGIFYHIHWWLLTPSYNWLALIGTLMVGTALLNAPTHKLFETSRLQFVLHAFYIAAGGAISFMGKPSTAVALGLLSAAWIFYHYRNRHAWFFLFVTASMFFALIGLHIYGHYNGPSDFYQNIQEGQSLFSLLLDEKFSLLVVFKKGFKSVASFGKMLIGILLVFYFFQLFLRKKIASKKIFSILFAMVNVIWLFMLIIVLKASFSGVSAARISNSMILGCVVILYNVIILFEIPRQKLSLLTPQILLFLLAFAYAFGSTNSLVPQMSGAGIFFVCMIILNALYLMQNMQSRRYLSVPLLLIGLTIGVFFIKGYIHPYHLPQSIAGQTHTVTFSGKSGSLKVDKLTFDYLNQLQLLANANGWKEGNALIDFTGATPGSAVMLNARFLITAWLLGGNRNSNQFAVEILNKAPLPTLEKAWILTAEKGSYRIDENILSARGLSFPEGYIRVGELKMGYRNEIQVLWKPR